MVKKRGVLQNVLKDNREEVRPKASKVENAKDLTPKNRRNMLKVRYKKLNVAKSPAQQFSVAWSIVKEISGRKGSSRSRIRARCPKERMKLWKEHFEGLLGQPPVVDDQPITTLCLSRLVILL